MSLSRGQRCLFAKKELRKQEQEQGQGLTNFGSPIRGFTGPA
jgi:hypothetical protein